MTLKGGSDKTKGQKGGSGSSSGKGEGEGPRDGGIQ
jgi:hypothetical protein